MFDLQHHLKQPPRDPAGTIPCIDLGEFYTPGDSPRFTDDAARAKAGEQICHAMYHVGFFTIDNHGVNANTMAQAFDQSKQFFDLPLSTKRDLGYTTTDVNRGYIGKFHERLEGTGTAKARYAGVTPNAQPDAKESFDVPSRIDNQWPQVLPDSAVLPHFTDRIYSLRAQMDRLHADIMSAIAVGIDLEPDFFVEYFRREQYSLRLLHYPQTAAALIDDEGQKRAGTHTDYNHMTLLLQDSVGGLQVLNAADRWIDVTPEPSHVVVNTGDLLERWSNGLFRSTVHRVVKPKTAGATLSSRYSMAYFVKPDRRATIACLPTCHNAQRPAQFEAVNCLDYVDAAFKEAGNENVAARLDAAG